MYESKSRKAGTSAMVLAACLLGFSGQAIAQTCFSVEGEVKTVNVSETTQVGSIEIGLFDSNDDAIFSETGGLVGTITGAGPIGQIVLSNTASFSDSGFVTLGDEAVITGVRALDAQNVPCSFFVSETITNIASGSGFFGDVASVNIEATGYIAFCSDDNGIADNENEFELTGQLCRNS